MAMRSNSGHFPSGFSFGNSDKMACQSRVKEAEIARIVRSTCSTMSMLCMFSKGNIALSLFSERGSLGERRLFRLRRRKNHSGRTMVVTSIKEIAKSISVPEEQKNTLYQHQKRLP